MHLSSEEVMRGYKSKYQFKFSVSALRYSMLFTFQYGFVNHALELLVLRNYGPGIWEDIK